MEKKLEKVLLTPKEMAYYLNIGETNARKLLSDPKNHFTVRMGNRIYAHKPSLDKWLKNQIM